MDDRLPKDTSSERAVIGAVLQDNITLNEIKHLLEPHDFADPTNTHYMARWVHAAQRNMATRVRLALA